MTGESRRPRPPDRHVVPPKVQALVQALIPDECRSLRITVEVLGPEPVAGDGVGKQGYGYDVFLCVGKSRVRVGDCALTGEVLEWHDSRAGPLPELVASAAVQMSRWVK